MRNCGYGFWENEDCRAESCRGGDERGHWDGNCCCGRDGTQGCGGDGRGGCGEKLWLRRKQKRRLWRKLRKRLGIWLETRNLLLPGTAGSERPSGMPGA